MTTNSDTLQSNFLERLKSDTASAHKNLEALPLSTAIVSENLTLNDYAKYLKVMHAIMNDAESKLFPIVQSVIPDIDNRKKAHHIKHDLQQIGHIPSDYTSVFSKSYSLPFALGIVYVLEGSTLGGRFIIQNIQKTLHLSPSNGAQYFYGYGQHTGSMWKAFLSNLSDHTKESGNQQAIIDGATYAFDLIHKQLSTPTNNED